ncbi:hypothetical protein F4779DRAFT_601087 [Xylariaceae sp. FL0662B]|nr:hypothetical protein F4779DRAFT_601087 [Xylariaceae sp. FL0662B]
MTPLETLTIVFRILLSSVWILGSSIYESHSLEIEQLPVRIYLPHISSGKLLILLVNGTAVGGKTHDRQEFLVH